MTDVSTGQSYGLNLPDQVERIAEFFDAHLEVLNDIRELYTSRMALEREYASKLQLIARKSSDKKAKTQSLFVVGGNPMKTFDSTVLKQSTIDMAYEKVIASFMRSAQDRIDIAEAVSTQTIETLKILGRRNEEAKRKVLSFFQKLLSDRDRVFADCTKSEQKYHDDCGEVESLRQKQGRAADDKHADRAARQAEQQCDNMHNSKNSYLVSTATANHVNAKFYGEDIPQLENELQVLQRRLVERFVKVLSTTQRLELNYLDSLKSRVADVDAKLHEVNIVKDQDLFINYNIRPFVLPDDLKFEPSPIHYDTVTLVIIGKAVADIDKAAMNVDRAPKIVLQNKLRRSKEKANELDALLKSKRVELSRMALELMSYKADDSVGAIDDLTDNYLDAEHQVVLYATSERILKSEIDTILAAIGDDYGASSPHAFKSSSFSIPTQCGYCQTMIWGIGKPGKTCKVCGLSIHIKCELKVAANCNGTQGKLSSIKDADPSRGEPIVNASTASAFVQSITPQEVVDEHIEALVLFDFNATSEFELEVREGMKVHILEPDDGSGWAKVADMTGDSGLVPASYLKPLDAEPSRETTRSGTGRRVRVIYAYKGQTSDELDIQEGEILELIPGGEDYGNGWWEGLSTEGKKGIFPSNYVELI